MPAVTKKHLRHLTIKARGGTEPKKRKIIGERRGKHKEKNEIERERKRTRRIKKKQRET
jgi:hypothetical protein